jgi:hypothetical protein
MQVHWVWLVVRIVVPGWSSSSSHRVLGLTWVVISAVSSHGVTRSLIVVSSASQRNLGLSCWHVHINIYRNSVGNQILIDRRNRVSSCVMQVHWVWFVIWVVIPSWSSSRSHRVLSLTWVVVSTVSSHGIARSLIVVSSTS